MNLEIVELEEWHGLMTHPYFQRLRDKLKGRIVQLNGRLKNEMANPSLDNAIKMAITVALINETQDLLNSFDHKETEFQMAKGA